MDIDQMLEKIEEAANLEGTEIGEFWQYLVSISKYRYCMTDEFEKALDKEIIASYNDINDNYTMIEEEFTTTRKVKTLNWNHG